MTLIDVVHVQSDRLDQAGVCFGHGTANAFDEAAWLALAALGLPLDALDKHALRDLSKVEQARVEEVVSHRIATRKPTAYLTHEAWLQGVPFYVDERAVVPRSLIAELIGDGTLDAWLPVDAKRVLDLCTGNGSVAVLAALAWPRLKVDATDISNDALAVARINVERHALADRIAVLQSDLYDNTRGRYDLILCNPPYVSAASMAALPDEYRAEPALALAGGADGMDIVRRVTQGAARYLSEHAVLVLEIGNERGNFERAFPRLEALWLETSAGADEVLLVTREAMLRNRPNHSAAQTRARRRAR